MPEGVAISNTGPLIAFAKIGRLDLLPALFTEILVPKAVADELKAGSNKIAGFQPLNMRGFRTVECQRQADRLLREIDSGEASVIELGIETPGAEILLDDRKARRIAESVYQLNILGTGGVLLRAKRRGVIEKIKPTFEQLRANGYFMSDKLIAAILKAAGEA